MRLTFYLDEYETNNVSVTYHFEDGTCHQDIVEKVLDTMSTLYGFDIKGHYAESLNNP